MNGLTARVLNQWWDWFIEELADRLPAEPTEGSIRTALAALPSEQVAAITDSAELTSWLRLLAVYNINEEHEKLWQSIQDMRQSKGI